jgi:glucan phosphoethanolaminetransferase (alkaline phosphatase superfamily)
VRAFGDRPSALLYVLAPTWLAIGLDLLLRARVLVEYPIFEAVHYTGGIVISAGFWGGSSWLASRLFVSRSKAARVGLAAWFLLWLLPFATFSFGGQALHYRVFHSYMARNTVRLGISLRGTISEWLAAWGGIASFVGIAAAGGLAALGIFLAARKAAPSLSKTIPVVPVVGLALSLHSLWIDNVSSGTLQATPPDTCFEHGVVHAARVAITGQGRELRGVSLRTPAPLPELPRAAHRPNVVFVITESVRADALCSAKTPACVSRFLDDVAPDRMPLGDLLTQSSGTFSSCVMMWTGLPPNADFTTLHRAATVWEIARAVGYHTAYVTSQNMQYNDFHLFTDHAGIEHAETGVDLGDVKSNLLGAPDELATAALLAHLRAAPTDRPTFAVLHLSNTHAPYRADPSLEPNTPHGDDPFKDLVAFHNHYKNAVLFQERTLASFFAELQKLPSFDDTVVLLVSDHGEQFREHGTLYHLHSLYEEEVRIPGFLFAGAHGLDDAQRAGLRAFSGRRTYTQDIHATLLDLFGVFDARPSLPFAAALTGRSLLRPPPPGEPIALMSTMTGVWETDPTYYGATQGSRVVMTSSRGAPICFDLARDPGERSPLPPGSCPALEAALRDGFPEAPKN